MTEAATPKSGTPAVWHKLLRNPLGLTGLLLTLLVVLAGLLAPLIAPYHPAAQDILGRMKPPTAAHWLGADQFGRDTLSRLLYGFRASLMVGLLSVALSMLLGGTLGVTAAFFGGWYDRVVMRLMDILLAFPIILLAIAIVAVLGPNLLNTALAIAVVYTPMFARLLRGPALVLRESEYVTAARALGASNIRLMARHILPNLMTVLLVQATLSLSTAILVEATLSFIGLGTQPPQPSLGLMLSEGRAFLTLSPWVSLFSGAAILVASLGFNLLGDALRDILDPRLRN